MKYTNEVIQSFYEGIKVFPEAVRAHLMADKYKYLTDVSLLLAKSQAHSKGAFLDVAGARGANALMLSQLGDFDLHVVDRFDTQDSEDGQHPTRAILEKANIKVAQCDVSKENLPYADESFDVISAVDLIEHFPYSSGHLFSELYRVLKPGGVLLTGCPNIVHLQNRLKMLFGATIHPNITLWHNKDKFAGHIREYTRQEMEWVLKETGFKSIQTRMGEEELLPVIKERYKLQRQRGAGSNRLDLRKFPELVFYIYVHVYYFFVRLMPNCRYFIRTLCTK